MGEGRTPAEGPIAEHRCWRGNNYRSAGINGQRVAIVGYSHYGDEDGYDDEQFTVDVLEKVISREFNIAFFTSIRNWFGFADHSDFWHRVVFFNYIPNAIGDARHRYAFGSPEQNEHARRRFLDILARETPQKVFVLSKKALSALPPTEEEKAGVGAVSLAGC